MRDEDRRALARQEQFLLVLAQTLCRLVSQRRGWGSNVNAWEGCRCGRNLQVQSGRLSGLKGKRFRRFVLAGFLVAPKHHPAEQGERGKEDEQESEAPAGTLRYQ